MVNDFEPLPPKALTVIRLRLLAPAGFVIVVLLVGAVAAFLGDVAGATTYGLVLAAVAVLVLAGWSSSGTALSSNATRSCRGPGSRT